MNVKPKSPLEEELVSLLEKVPDAYPDFVYGTWLSVKKKEEHIKQMIEFLQNNPKASSSEVMVAECRIVGIKTIAELNNSCESYLLV